MASSVVALLVLAFLIWAFITLALSTDKSQILPNYSNYILSVGNTETYWDYMEDE
jgi:hypothetical protein